MSALAAVQPASQVPMAAHPTASPLPADVEVAQNPPETAMIPPPAPVSPPVSLRDAIRAVRGMTGNRDLRRSARAHRMVMQTLSWEDTGRYFGSSVGPNISDLTLEVIDRSGRRPRTSLLPVMRYPNFTDRTADVAAEQFWVRAGNHSVATPDQLQSVPLREVIAHLRSYLSVPESLRSESDDFSAARDSHYLVSAQQVFVPIPQGVRVEWAPVLFNYQSDPGSPAVLCLVVTREGTSATIIENRTDPLHPEGWGQRLFFNHGGQRTLFTAERQSDIRARVESGNAESADATALQAGANMVMIVQIPLRQRLVARSMSGAGVAAFAEGSSSGAPSRERTDAHTSDVEHAAVGHGVDEGPFIEMRRQRLRRDARFPIRVTIQFYQATSNGVITPEQIDTAAQEIERVYSDADFVGSLVVGSQDRPTSWVRPSVPSPN